jgi:uncharacterized membrane protein YraQ (UPF0718 family)
MKQIKNKALLLTILLVTILAINFWVNSRYPALDEKALMGGETPIFGIAFDNLIVSKPSDSISKKILNNTFNWVYTNKQGMTFGLLFAAAFMLFFKLIKKKAFKNRFSNAILGMFIGAPLGVCVNCAAPIAKGMKAGGSKSETSIAMMMSSPTLNIVVLTMLFTILPWYLGAIKLVFTFLLLWVFIPLLSRFIPDENNRSITISKRWNKWKWLTTNNSFQEDVNLLNINSSWMNAIKWFVSQYFKNLWFIVKTTVPLMLLAGFLGSVLTTVLPWEILPDLFNNLGWIKALILMCILAVICVFLPVPIAFDVIITAVLLSAGLPAQYAMILLFALGIYSIYAFFIVGQIASIKMGLALAFVVGFLAISSGIIAKNADKFYKSRLLEHYFSSLKDLDFHPERLEWKSDAIKITSKTLNLEQIKLEGNFPANIEVFKIQHFERKNSHQKGFTKFEGPELGISEDYYFEVKHTLLPFVSGKGLAAGDINKDGWPDIILTTGDDVIAYINENGQGFRKQTINVPHRNDSNLFIWNAALVDMNGDSWLDLVFTTFSNGNYIIYNTNGEFITTPHELPIINRGGVTSGLGFGDLDNDGDLDIACSNWTIGPGGAIGGKHYQPFNSSVDYILWNEGDSFRIEKLLGPPGETLSLLLSDINGDNTLDLIVGNDFRGSDNYYLNDGKGEMKLVSRLDNLIPVTTNNTMSIHSADINNDLTPELYLAATSEMGLTSKWITTSPAEICDGLNNTNEKQLCTEIFSIQQKIVGLGMLNDISRIEHDLPALKDDFIAYRLWREIAKRRNFDPKSTIPSNLCTYIPENFFPLNYICETEAYSDYSIETALKNEIPQTPIKNVLLKKNKNGSWDEVDAEFGLSTTGWTWNAKFADLDLDYWQDIFITNGFMFNEKQNSNLYFSNQGGKIFVNTTTSQNLENRIPTHSSLYIDYDMDGDQDIIIFPSVGPVVIYKNNAVNNSIAIQLKNNTENTYGIGAKIICITKDNKMQQFREIQASGGFKSFDAPVAYFGLGNSDYVDEIQIVWPGGDTTKIKQRLPSNYTYIITRK